MKNTRIDRATPAAVRLRMAAALAGLLLLAGLGGGAALAATCPAPPSFAPAVTALALPTVSISTTTPQVQEDIKDIGTFVLRRSSTETLQLPPQTTAGFMSGPLASPGSVLHKGDTIGYIVVSANDVEAADGCAGNLPASATPIVSPIDGTLGSFTVTTNIIVQAGAAIATASNPNHYTDSPLLVSYNTTGTYDIQVPGFSGATGFLSGPMPPAHTPLKKGAVIGYVVTDPAQILPVNGTLPACYVTNPASCTNFNPVVTITMPVNGTITLQRKFPGAILNTGGDTIGTYSKDPIQDLDVPALGSLASTNVSYSPLTTPQATRTAPTAGYVSGPLITPGTQVNSDTVVAYIVTNASEVRKADGTCLNSPCTSSRQATAIAPASGYLSGPFAPFNTEVTQSTVAAYIVSDPSQVEDAAGNCLNAPCSPFNPIASVSIPAGSTLTNIAQNPGDAVNFATVVATYNTFAYTGTITIPAGSTLSSYAKNPGDAVTVGNTVAVFSGSYLSGPFAPLNQAFGSNTAVAYVVADPNDALAAGASLPACYVSQISPCSFDPIATIDVPSGGVLLSIAGGVGTSITAGETVATYRAGVYLSGPFAPLNQTFNTATVAAYIVGDPSQVEDAAGNCLNSNGPCATFNPIASLMVPQGGTLLSLTASPGAVANAGETVGSYEDTAGTAAAGIDFVPMPGTATFPIGQDTLNVEMIPSDDNDPTSGDEALTVTLAAGSGYLVDGSAQNNQATITLVEPPVIQISSTPATLAAGTTQVTPGSFIFTRSGDVTGPMTFEFTPGGTAVDKTDYTLSGGADFTAPATAGAPYTLTLQPGERSATVTVNPLGGSTAVNTVTLSHVTVPLTVPNNAPSPGWLSGPLVRPAPVGKSVAYVVGTQSEVVAADGDLCALPEDPQLLSPCPADEIGIPMPQFGTGGAGMVTSVTMVKAVGSPVSRGDTVAQLSVDEAASLVLAGTQVSPAVSIVPRQASGDRRLILINGGTVTARAVVTDANPGDTATYDWSTTDAALAPLSDTTSGSYTFDPSSLTAGLYTLRVKVTDNTGLSTTAALLIKVVASLPSLDHDSGAMELMTTQGMNNPEVIAIDGGDATISIDDLDPTHSYTYDWSATAAAITPLNGTSAATLHFEPSGLAAGIYTVSVTVTDTNTSKVTTVVRDIQVAATSTGAHDDTETDDIQDSDGDGTPDATEGYTDVDNDGIPDYMDPSTLALNVLQEVPLDPDEFLITTEPGLALGLGNVAFAAGHGGADVTADDIAAYGGAASGANNPTVDPDGDCPPGAAADCEPYFKQDSDADSPEDLAHVYMDFIVSGLAQAGMTANVVVPQQTALPAGAQYRIYHPGSGWRDFVVNDKNQLTSCCGQSSLDQYNSGQSSSNPSYGNTGGYPGSSGNCPPPGSDNYYDVDAKTGQKKPRGLIEGATCVQLTIEDGGPNDTDGTANHVIADPGVVIGTAPAGGSSGGGVLGWSALAALAGLYFAGAAARRLRRR